MILNRPIPFRFRAPEPGDDGAGKLDFGDEHVGDEDDTTVIDKEPVAKEPAKKEPAKDEGKEGEGDEGKDGDDKDTKGDADKNKRPDTRIPLARHKELLAKEREVREDLERQLAKFKGGESIAATNEKITADEKKLITLEGEYTKLVTDGEHEKAAAKMGEIRKLERGIGETKNTLLTAAAESRAYERVKYDMTVQRVEEAYPVINPDHADYDDDKAAEVLELKGAYQLKGYTPADALQKAAKIILGAATRKQEAAVDVDARPDKDDVAKQVAADRKKAAVAKNVEVDKKQPKATDKVGADSDKAGAGILDGKAVLNMKYNDFVKLDDEVLAKIRGDEL